MVSASSVLDADDAVQGVVIREEAQTGVVEGLERDRGDTTVGVVRRDDVDVAVLARARMDVELVIQRGEGSPAEGVDVAVDRVLVATVDGYRASLAVPAAPGGDLLGVPLVEVEVRVAGLTASGQEVSSPHGDGASQRGEP